MQFVNREREVAKVRSLLDLPRSLNLLYGQRRVGKTRLLQESLKWTNHVYFLARNGSSLENLRDLLQEWNRQRPDSVFDDVGQIESWPVFFSLLQQEAGNRQMVLILDEFQYLLEAEPQLPSLIQRFWDRIALAGRGHLFLCGSALGTMARLGQAEQPLYGRFTWEYQLFSFDYYDASKFVRNWSPRQRFLAYGIFGGFARHLEFIDPDSNPVAELVRNILDPLGGLHGATAQMLQTERIREPGVYLSVLRAVAGGVNRPGQIQSHTGLTTGSVNNALQGLQELKMIEKRIPFGEKPTTTRSLYRLSDPYLQFWFRFVDPNRSLLRKTEPGEVFSKQVEARLDTYMGKIFEQICHQFLERFGTDRLGDPLREISNYWSRDGCFEIDILAKLGKERFLVGECKWRYRRAVGSDVLGDLKRKLEMIGKEEWIENAQFLLATSSHFSKELRSNPEVLLLEPADLLP